VSLEELFKLIATQKEPETSTVPTWILCGLGNPGDRYEKTRHNVGFRVMDLMAEKCGWKIKRLAHKALTERVTLTGSKGGSCSVLVMKPQTFMNASGEAVGEAARFYKIPPERVLIVYDDVSMPEGQIRVRGKGSDGGHNGIKSILYHLQSDRFPRIKVGVGAPPTKEYDMADWVLGAPSGEAALLQKEGEARAAEAVSVLIEEGVERAMALFNAAPAKKKKEEAPGEPHEEQKA